MTQLGLQSIFVLIFSFSSWNSARAGTCCYCVYLQCLLLFFQGSVMTRLHLFIPGLLCHVARIKMCIMCISSPSMWPSGLRRGQNWDMMLYICSHGNIWENFFRGKIKNNCFTKTNKMSEYAKLVSLGYV